MTDLSAPASTALLSTLAYQNLCVAEMLLAPPRQHDDVGQRAHLGRLAGDALERFSALCDAVPGGFAAARDAMDRAASPVDEFITMTTPRDGAESWLRLAAMASWEIELIERMTERDPDRLGEVARDTTGLWCRLEAAATGVLGATEANEAAVSTLALYRRRLVGEVAVVSQRLIVREPAFRMAVAGDSDDDLTISGPFVTELLGAISATLARIQPAW